MDCYMITAIVTSLVYVVCGSQTCQVDIYNASCSGRNLTNILQELPTSISVLDLSVNKITELKNYTFKRYNNLSVIHLENNLIRVLEVYAFHGLEKLENLFISNNKLDLSFAYVPGVFSPLARLTNLDISRNMPEATSSYVQYPLLRSLVNLTTLALDLAVFPVFDDSGIQSLQHFTKIIFDNCYIQQMTNKTFLYIANVKELHLRNCKYIISVSFDSFRPLTQLLNLSIYNSNMEFSSALELLNPFENKTMNTIDFTRVNPGYESLVNTPNAVIITSKMMAHLQKICVRTLILAENGIVDFEPMSLFTYHFPECFENIVLSGNRFSFINGFKVNELYQLSPKLTNLISFDLSYNPLSYDKVIYDRRLPHDQDPQYHETLDQIESAVSKERTWYTCLNTTVMFSANSEENLIFIPLPPKLRTLRLTSYLSGQKLRRPIVLQNASNLQHLDLSYFAVNNFPRITLDIPSKINYIDLSGIASWRQSITLFTNAKTVVLKYAGIWNNIQKTKHFFNFIPNVEHLDITGNALWQLPYDTFSCNKKLSNLTISGNLFNDLPTALLTVSKLKYLDVSANILDNINKTIRDWIDRQQKQEGHFKLILMGNVFKCTCETMDFVQWIFKTKVTFDKPNRDYMCCLSNGSITNTVKVYQEFQQLFSTCESSTWLRVGIILLVLFVVFTVPLALVLNFKWQISYWIYRKFRKVIQTELKEKFKYDIYLSYSKDSLHWVKNILMPKIENSWKMKMCLEDREFLVGDIYADAISDSIKLSRNILFIITDNFSSKDWGKFEIERAKYEKYTRNLQKIIVITKNVSIENFPIELSNIGRDVVLVDLSEDKNESSWDKLRMALASDFV